MNMYKLINTAHHINEVYDLYVKDAKTQKEIALLMGVTPQRISQILKIAGATKAYKEVAYKSYPQTLQNESWLKKHSHMRSSKLAVKLNVDRKTVAYYRRLIPHRYMPESGGPLVGHIWENAVIEKLDEMGLTAEGMTFAHKFDILVNSSIKIDVKASVTPWRARQSYSPLARLRNKTTVNLDFYIVVVAWEGAPTRYFIIPAAHKSVYEKEYFYVITNPKREPKENSLATYEDRWDLVSEAVGKSEFVV